MSGLHHENFAEIALAGMGYNVRRVAESDVAHPDLLAECGSEVLAVECKSIGPSGAKPGRFGVRSDPHYKRAGVGSAIKKAAKQLNSPAVPEDAIRVVWISSIGILDSVFELRRAEGELLGLRSCVVPNPSGSGGVSMKALFAWPGRFERNSRLDCAILVSNAGAQLYVNSFSSQRQRVLQSKIFQEFSKYRAAVDLESVGPSDGFLVCDTGWQRGDESALKMKLAEKYGYSTYEVHIVDFVRHHLSGKLPPSRA